MDLKELRPEIKSITRNPDLSDQLKLQGICDFLHRSVSYYDWVGFYMADHERKVLELAVQAGEPTDHIEIPFGKGICGQVAVSNENFLVPDVSLQDNYIACSMATKSELVVPILIGNVNIGQIDIDSHTADAFNEEDEKLMEFITAEAAKFLSTTK
jgi:GAF domain-containing protein